MIKKDFYIAGPMRGYPESNYPAFHAAAEDLREQGFTVENPAEHSNGDFSLSFAEYMRRDIESLMSVRWLALQEGWEKSQGSLLEVQIGIALGLSVFRYVGRRQALVPLRLSAKVSAPGNVFTPHILSVVSIKEEGAG